MFDLLSRLMDFYMVIGMPYFSPTLLEHITNDFCLLYKALASTPKSRWYLKPKLHLMQELAISAHEMGDPTMYWTYMDEDFMGLVSAMACSRGGPRNPSSVPENVFVRYAAL